MHLVIIGGCAAARVVFLGAISACLCLSAHHCNMAIGPALAALGHDALTTEDCAIFELMVMYESIKNLSVCYF